MTLVHNEKVKLLATSVNTVGTAAIIGGVVTPLVAATYGLPGTGTGLFTILVSAGWLIVGLGLHFVARAVLTRLKE